MALGKEKGKEGFYPSLAGKAPGHPPPIPELEPEAPQWVQHRGTRDLISPQAVTQALRTAGRERVVKRCFEVSRVVVNPPPTAIPWFDQFMPSAVLLFSQPVNYFLALDA